MIIVIDGYNVLRHVSHEQGARGERDRQKFVAQLRRYAGRKGHKIVAVFDGGQMPHVTREQLGDILVLWAGYRGTADEVIVDYVRRHQGRDLLVVSTDRQVCAAVHAMDVETIDGADFYALLVADHPDNLERRSEHADEARKIASDEGGSVDVDLLMRTASTGVQEAAWRKRREDAVPDGRARIQRDRRLSKRERRMRKKVEKL